MEKILYKENGELAAIIWVMNLRTQLVIWRCLAGLSCPYSFQPIRIALARALPNPVLEYIDMGILAVSPI
jgi:hypothetical protein